MAAGHTGAAESNAAFRPVPQAAESEQITRPPAHGASLAIDTVGGRRDRLLDKRSQVVFGRRDAGLDTPSPPGVTAPRADW